MPILVPCPHCQTEYHLADQEAGRALKCKSCGKAFQVGGEKTGDGKKTAPTSAPAQRKVQIAQTVFFVLLTLSIALRTAKYFYFDRNREKVPEVVYLSPPPTDIRDTMPKQGIASPPSMQTPLTETIQAWAARAVEISAPRPAEKDRRPDQATAATALARLTSPAAALRERPDRPVYFVDYHFYGNRPDPLGDRWFLVVESSAGISEWDFIHMPFWDLKYAGRLPFAFAAGKDPGGNLSVWLECQFKEKDKDIRVRASNVLTLQ